MTATVPTTDLHGIVTLGKTQHVFDFTATSAGEKSIRFTSESEAIKVSLNITDKTSSKVYWELYEEPGDGAGHERLIYQSPTNGNKGVETLMLPAVGKIRIDLYYTGAITLEMSVTGISAISALTSLPVQVLESDANDVFKQKVLACLSSIDDRLDRILNHQREITGIEADKGENF
jgi:hypothetical protein